MAEFEQQEVRKPSEEEGVIFLLYRNGRFLVEDRLKRGHGSFGHTLIPGGKIEKGETPEEAMRREIREETGVIPTEFVELDTFENVTLNFNYRVFHAYLVTQFDGEVENIEPEKGRFCWVSIPEAWDILRMASSRYILCLAQKFID